MKENIKHKFNYKWKLDDLKKVEKNGYKVFSTFACGGGSTMGYKLAGYDVIGMNEIDKKLIEVYKVNHNPKLVYDCDIREMVKMDLPKELYNLDILDGSPPCSNFSMSGNREQDWGKEKKFREGQTKQVLDTLFFDFIDLAKRLQPKIIIAENVKGIILGNAKKYSQKIIKETEKAGYWTEYWLLNASKMGVPQRRQRIFFISIRRDIAEKIKGQRQNLLTRMPYLDFKFNENEINYSEIADYKGKKITEHQYIAWKCRDIKDTKLAESKVRAGMKYNDFNNCYVKNNKPIPTITGKGNNALLLYDKPIRTSDNELILASSFPKDYNFLNNSPGYIVGMSVPPVVMAQISYRIKNQWLDKIV